MEAPTATYDFILVCDVGMLLRQRFGSGTGQAQTLWPVHTALPPSSPATSSTSDFVKTSEKSIVFSGVLAGGSQANSLRNSPSSQLAFALLSNLSNLFHGNFHGCKTDTSDLKAQFLRNFLISNLHPADLDDSLEIITFPL